MSYAGPASRTSRAASSGAEIGLIRPEAAAGRRRRPTRRPLPSHSTDAGDRTMVFVAGLMVGLAVGAGATLLIAPQAGPDTRRSLRRMTKRFGRRGHDAWEDLRDEFRRYRRQRRRSRSLADASSL